MLIFHIVLALAGVALVCGGLLFAGAFTLIVNLAWAVRTYARHKVGVYKV